MIGDDLSLLREFGAQRTDSAFSAIVQRHIGLVHSAALRTTAGNTDLAQEIAQKVFILLAQKAAGLNDRTVLSAWLYRATLYVAADMLKRNRRRQIREHEACMLSQINDADTTTIWCQLAPMLDEAMRELADADRAALVLRYFENKTVNEVAAALQIGEAAAQKRVLRALDKLRRLLTVKGVTLGAATIIGALTANAIQAAPATLATTITTTTLAGAGLTVTTIAMTTLQKIAVTAALTLTIGAGIYEATQAHDARAEVQTLQQQREQLARQVTELKAENQRLPTMAAQNKESHMLSQAQFNELLRLRGEVAKLRGDSKELAQFRARDFEKANDLTDVAARDWARRAADLAERVGQMSESRMPEFQFLTPADWLDIAKDARLETSNDFSNAVSMLGALAKDRFAGLMSTALRGFLDAHHDELPTELSQLKPFFPVTIEDDVLQGYQLVKSGNVNDLEQSDRLFGLVSEKPFAPAGSGRPLIQIGTQGFLRTGQ